MDTHTPIVARAEDDADVEDLALLRQLIVEMLDDVPMPVPRASVVRQLGRRRSVAFEAINSLVNDGTVRISRGPRNRADLSLAS